MSQKGRVTSKGNLRQDTPQKPAGAAGRGIEGNPRRRATNIYPTQSRRREVGPSSAATEGPAQTRRDNQQPRLATTGDGPRVGQAGRAKRQHH